MVIKINLLSDFFLIYSKTLTTILEEFMEFIEWLGDYLTFQVVTESWNSVTQLFHTRIYNLENRLVKLLYKYDCRGSLRDLEKISGAFAFEMSRKVGKGGMRSNVLCRWIRMLNEPVVEIFVKPYGEATNCRYL